jgi:hypothetical protein
MIEVLNGKSMQWSKRKKKVEEFFSDSVLEDLSFDLHIIEGAMMRKVVAILRLIKMKYGACAHYHFTLLSMNVLRK